MSELKAVRKATNRSAVKAAKWAKAAAQAFRGSRLKKRTGETASTIYTMVKPHMRTTNMILTASTGLLNIWEIRGRRRYDIVPKRPRMDRRFRRLTLVQPKGGTKKALRLPWGIFSKVTVPATGPRPVLKPALMSILPRVDRELLKQMETAVLSEIPRTIRIRAKR